MNPALQVTELEPARERLHAIRSEVSRVFLGDTQTIDLLLVAILARGHVLLEGVPGVAKTTLVKAFAQTLGCVVRRIQFTPDLLPADITGTYVLNPRDGVFAFRGGPVFANVVLADEINRAPAKTQSALLEAMQERQVTIEGDRFELPDPFFVLATQNPIELEGTYPLPEAQIDRFMVRVSIKYPQLRDEVSMLKAHGVVAPQPAPVIVASDIQHLQSIAARVFVEDDLYEYTARLTAYTRTHPKVLLGASPRASLSLLRAAKSRAVLEGRPFVVPDDLRALAEPVLAHRLIVVPELEADHHARAQIVDEAIARVPYRKAVRPA
ncbi:MAG: MoxR family ATPase [Polyangiaceae bacterium]